MNKKNSKASKKIGSSFFNTKGKIIGVCVVAAIILIIVAIFMFIESGYGKIIVKNNTALNLEYVKTSFINLEGIVDTGVQVEGVDAGKTLTTPNKPAKLLNTQSNMEVRFKFAGQKEMFTDVGEFNLDFDGNIYISFEKTDDPNLITFKIKASNGIFKTRYIECDDEFTINLSEGKILQ